jgi:membrane fusion protein (multidrug efflux system)
MLGDNVLERSEPSLQEFESPRSVLVLRREPNAQAWKQEVKARAPLRPDQPAPECPVLPAQAEEGQPQAAGKGRRNRLLHCRPVVCTTGALLLASMMGAGYAYLDYAGHFRSTDDAFIAARQSALAPKVPGYISAVLVTDNEHVAKGGVIARIDDRDYRIALEQTQAQVAAAQASIDNIDAQLNVQQAQISANKAQVDQAQAALVFAQQQATRYQDLAR